MVTDLFGQVDTDGSGSLDKEEIGLLLAELGNPLDPDDLTKVMAEIDADGNEDVDLQEFRTWWNTYSSREMITEAMDPHEQYLKKTFDAADANQDGKLDKGELRELMGYLGEADFEFAMATMDDGGEGGQAGDGAIDFEEFKIWYDVLVTVDFLCDESGGCLPPFETTFDFSLLQKVAILAAKKLDIASRDQFLDDDLVLAAFGVPPAPKLATLSFEQVEQWWQQYKPRVKPTLEKRVDSQRLPQTKSAEVCSDTQDKDGATDPKVSALLGEDTGGDEQSMAEEMDCDSQASSRPNTPAGSEQRYIGRTASPVARTSGHSSAFRGIWSKVSGVNAFMAKRRFQEKNKTLALEQSSEPAMVGSRRRGSSVTEQRIARREARQQRYQQVRESRPRTTAAGS